MPPLGEGRFVLPWSRQPGSWVRPDPAFKCLLGLVLGVQWWRLHLAPSEVPGGPRRKSTWALVPGGQYSSEVIGDRLIRSACLCPGGWRRPLFIPVVINQGASRRVGDRGRSTFDSVLVSLFQV